MLIKDNMVVSIHYTLKNEAGQILDSSQDGEPLSYLHGNNNIIPGLENALTGKKIGEHFNISIPPEDGYGVRDERLVQVLPRNAFEGIERLEPGMQFQARSDKGIQIITVTKVDGDRVTVDGNHALAGEVLNFEIEVTHIRPATEEELAHGHVHGSGEHH